MGSPAGRSSSGMASGVTGSLDAPARSAFLRAALTIGLARLAVRRTRATWSCGYGVTVRLDILVTPPKVAVICTGVLVVTAVVLIVKVADVAPAGTVTVGDGAATAELRLVSVTTAPPAGAGPFNVTVLRLVDLPPFTLVGDNLRDASFGEFTVRQPVLVTPL